MISGFISQSESSVVCVFTAQELLIPNAIKQMDKSIRPLLQPSRVSAVAMAQHSMAQFRLWQ